MDNILSNYLPKISLQAKSMLKAQNKTTSRKDREKMCEGAHNRLDGEELK